MLSLKNFTEKKLSNSNLRNVNGGSETGGGAYFFGYGISECDWNNGGGNCFYYFSGGGRVEAECIC